MADSHICSVEGCGKKREAKGLCNPHYQRLIKFGSAMPEVPLLGNKRGHAKEFIEQIAVPHEGEDCLIWPFAKVKNGYGSIGTKGRTTDYVHRVVCEMAWGAAPEGRPHVAHSCGNRICCNPNHLRWCTQAENMADKNLHGTDNRGQKHPLAKLKNSDIPEIRRMATSMTHKQIAKIFGVSRQAIDRIVTGEAWRVVQ